MNGTHIFFIASAVVCFALAVFGQPIFEWSNRLTRRLGFHRLADFRERLGETPLVLVARIVMFLAAILILFLMWKLPR